MTITFARLEAKGYDVKVKGTDEKGVIRGYILKKGNARFKASELGKGRNLMASKLEGTWNKLRPNQERQTKADSRNPIFDRIIPLTDPIPAVSIFGAKAIHTPGLSPKKVMQVFYDEFDNREVDNWADLMNEACYHFAVAMSYMAFLNAPAHVSGGGGTSNNDLPRKRDNIEEEIARPSLCRSRPLKDRNCTKTRFQKINTHYGSQKI